MGEVCAFLASQKLKFHSKNIEVAFLGQARKSLWIETYSLETPLMAVVGQARKSLWIETINHTPRCYDVLGQARKSLWIETQWRQQ